ncbi:MAG: polysaccharide deacetylase family protein [Verrucomicrobiaceae bacterium]|nr:polysaccharide deacetylase family protein [Verrucomicrobiaceae bacterium]NCF91825.1 polysaccharide deacetylase family protein [Verrucomicrobiaceae bacterium]
MLLFRQVLSILALLACLAGCEKIPAPEEPVTSVPEAVEAPLEAEPTPPADLPPPPEPDTPDEAVDTTSKVAVLGYHKFSASPEISRKQLPTTIFIEKFREQMQTLADNEIPVIGMGDFLAWRRGEKNIPPFSVIITIDDGYVSTYDLAFPILKEFDFPFTVYPYTNFFGGAGKTLSKDEVLEMVAAGGEIGSHGISHGFLNRQGRRSDEIHAAFLKKEATDSRRILKEKTGQDPVTFSYPYGAYDDRVIAACVDAGYAAMVTVRGRKVSWETDLKEMGRYIVHGEDDRAFAWALSSRLAIGLVGASNLLKETTKDKVTGEEKPLVDLFPANGSTIKERQPTISANLSLIGNIDLDTLSMSVSGLGKVGAQYDEATKFYSYTPLQRFRLPDYRVLVQFVREGEKKPSILRWKFSVDAIANYLEHTPKPSEQDDSVAISEPAKN